MTALRAIIRRVFRGPAFAGLLERCGITPRQYWVLVDLFDTLGARQEVAGMETGALRAATIVWVILSSAISLLMLAAGSTPGMYLTVFLVITVFQLSVILVAEVSESLVNPVAGLILAHQPVNGATWTAATLTHLIIVVVYMVAGINGVPALVGVLLPHTDRIHRVTYLPMHFLVALGVGLVVALLCCSLFGWLVRFVPVRRLKAAAATVQVFPLMFLFGFPYLHEVAAEIVTWADSTTLPAEWVATVEAVPGGFPALLGAAGVAVATVAAVFGLRALSADHLIRVSGLMQSPIRMQRRRRRRFQLGQWIARVAGGQAGRAGYEFLRCMLVRDWQFRRNMAIQAAPLVIWFIVLLVVGREVSPFDPGFAAAYFLPHLFGVTIIITCRFLPYGNYFKGIWSFGVVPDSSFHPFARGIYAALWFMLVVARHVCWLFVLAWSWGVTDAFFFIAHSTVAASLYLGLGLRLVHGIPFGKQTPSAAGGRTVDLLLIYPVILGMAIGIQYVLFRSVAAVVVSTVVVGVGTYYLTRPALARFASRMRSNLSPAAPGSMFRHVYEEAE